MEAHEELAGTGRTISTPAARKKRARTSSSGSIRTLSHLAKDKGSSIAWQVGAGIFFRDVEANTHVDAHKLFNDAGNFPKAVAEKSYPLSLKVMNRFQSLYDSLRRIGVATTLVDDFPEEDAEFLESMVPHIVEFCLAMRRLKDEETTFEAELRMPVDALVRSILLRLDKPFHYGAGRALMLPRSPDFTQATAIADIVMFYRIPHLLPETLGEGIKFLETEAKPGISVMLWACEYKALERGQNQLAYDLRTGQFQRRALGYTDHSIYGATITAGLATFYVSFWGNIEDEGTDSGLIYLERMGEFSIVDIEGAIRFVNLFRAIQNYNASLMELLTSTSKEKVLDAQSRGLGSWQEHKATKGGKGHQKYEGTMPAASTLQNKKTQLNRDIAEFEEGNSEAMDIENELSSDRDEGAVQEADSEVDQYEDRGRYAVRAQDLDVWERTGGEERESIASVEAWRRKATPRSTRAQTISTLLHR